MHMIRPLIGMALAAACFAAITALPACSSKRGGDFLTEPKTGGEYLIARPANYDPRSAWPLIVVCPSAFPDSPKRQLEQWSRLADERGFLVAVPQLQHDRRMMSRETQQAQSEQSAASRQIVGTVDHVRAGHNVSEDRILLYGYGRGAEAALHAGLRHPQIFRAVSVIEPVVENGSLAGSWPQIDPWQPVHVGYSRTDLLHSGGYEALLSWLRGVGVSVRPDPTGTPEKDRPARAVAFFDSVLRKEPWASVIALRPDPREPLRVQLRLRTGGDAGRIAWNLGEGATLAGNDPVYTYPAAGSYEVKVTFTAPGGDGVTRSVWLTLPEGTVSPRPPGGARLGD